MRNPFRPRPTPTAVAGLVLAFVTCLVALSAAGGTRSRATTTWSRSSSGKGVRSEIRQSTADSEYQSTSVTDDDPAGELDAWTFSRNHGHWRDTSGSERDWDDVQEILDRTSGDLFWFRRGTERYLVTDREALEQLASVFAPQEELGRKQGELGRRQGELGRVQGELGRKQGELGRIQARLGRIQASLSMEQAARNMRNIETASVDRELDEVSRQQTEVGELQAKLGDRQGALGERQSKLGEQQSELGREQERVSREVARQLGTLTSQWIASGVAKPVEP